MINKMKINDKFIKIKPVIYFDKYFVISCILTSKSRLVDTILKPYFRIIVIRCRDFLQNSLFFGFHLNGNLMFCWVPVLCFVCQKSL